MRPTIFMTLVAVSLLPATTFAQTAPQTAAIESAAPAPSAPTGNGGITRDQFIQRAKDRAAERAGARFDQAYPKCPATRGPARRGAARIPEPEGVQAIDGASWPGVRSAHPSAGSLLLLVRRHAAALACLVGKGSTQQGPAEPVPGGGRCRHECHEQDALCGR